MERRAILRIDPWIERIWVPGHTPLELGCLFERNRHRYRDRTPRQGFAGLLGLRTHPANDTPLAAKLARHTALVTRPHVRLRCRLRTGPEQRRRRVCQRGHQRHVLPDGLRQDLVDEGLVADAPPLGLLAELPTPGIGGGQPTGGALARRPGLDSRPARGRPVAADCARGGSRRVFARHATRTRTGSSRPVTSPKPSRSLSRGEPRSCGDWPAGAGQPIWHPLPPSTRPLPARGRVPPLAPRAATPRV
jgi:hypothetical protein